MFERSTGTSFAALAARRNDLTHGETGMKEEPSEGQTRREFCARVATLAMCGGAIGAILEGCGGGSPTAPGRVASLPIVNGTRAGAGITVAIDSGSPLAATGTAALVQASNGVFLVAHTDQSAFVALSAICTHQTCTITGFGDQTYVCPCHGSTFDLNGRVLGGPAPAALRKYTTQFTDGILTI